MKSLGTCLVVSVLILTTSVAFAPYRFRDNGSAGARSQSQSGASNSSGRGGARRDGFDVGGRRGATGIANSRVNSAISGLGRGRSGGRGR